MKLNISNIILLQQKQNKNSESRNYFKLIYLFRYFILFKKKLNYNLTEHSVRNIQCNPEPIKHFFCSDEPADKF